jgi:hypothetical protein
MNAYTGAGVIPLIKFNKKIYFILFSSGKNIISDAGGTIDKNESILSTAIRELKEESCGIININENTLKNNSIYFDVLNNNKNNKYYNKLYRIYFILIDNIDLYDLMNYYSNLKKFKQYDFNPYVETFGIHLISLDWIHYYNNQIYMNTHTNKIKKLNNRLELIISHIIDKYDNLDTFYKKIIKKLKFIHLDKCLINITTYSYKTYKKIYVDNLISYCVI